MRSALALLLVASTGCGTLMAPKQRPVQVMSNPPGAEVLVDGQSVGYTPGVVQVENKRDHNITFRLNGYNDGVCLVKSEVAVLWVVLDIWFLVPLIVDAATGGWKEITTTMCNLNLLPLNVPPPPPPLPS
jgi:PEGA domain